MLEKIKIKLFVITAIIMIISVFTLFTTWLGTSLWWLVSGDMVTRVTFFYIYAVLTTIPLLLLLFDSLKILKNKYK